MWIKIDSEKCNRTYVRLKKSYIINLQKIKNIGGSLATLIQIIRFLKIKFVEFFSQVQGCGRFAPEADSFFKNFPVRGAGRTVGKFVQNEAKINFM